MLAVRLTQQEHAAVRGLLVRLAGTRRTPPDLARLARRWAAAIDQHLQAEELLSIAWLLGIAVVTPSLRTGVRRDCAAWSARLDPTCPAGHVRVGHTPPLGFGGAT